MEWSTLICDDTGSHLSGGAFFQGGIYMRPKRLRLHTCNLGCLNNARIVVVNPHKTNEHFILKKDDKTYGVKFLRKR